MSRYSPGHTAWWCGVVLSLSSMVVGTAASAQAGTAEPPGEPPAQEKQDSAAGASEAAPSAKEESTKELAPVVVTAQRRKSAVSRSVLSGDELRSVPGTGGDTMKALQSLPGVAVADDSSSAPAIRGSRPSDNAYYVDSLPVGYLFHVGGLVSTVHSDLVRQFDLYSSAFGPEYDNVTGAVLDVTLRAPRTDRLHGSLDVSLLGADFLVEGPVTQNQSFYFAAKRSYLDLLLNTVKDDDTGVILTVPRYNDYQGKYLWHLNEDHRLTLHATGAADHLALKVPADSSVALQDPVLAGDSASDTSYATQAVVWDGEFGNRISNKLAIGHTTDKQTTSLGSALRVTSKTSEVFLREQLRVRPSAAHDVLVGGAVQSIHADYDLNFRDARCTEFEPECDLTSAPQKHVIDGVKAHFYSAFAKDRWQVSPDWALTGGLRYSRDGYLRRNYTEPRIGVEWKWSEDTLFTAGWGRHNQFPEGDQVIKDVGNPGLWHVRADHSVVGVTQKLGTGWSVKAEAYHKKLTDFVVADPALNYVNGGSGEANGLELFVKKEPTSALSGWLSVSLSRARRHNDATGEEFPFAFDQPVIITLVGNYKLNDRWQFGAKWSYHTGAPDTPIVSTTTDPDGRVRPVYGPINSDRLPSYHRLDLRAERTVSPTFSYYVEMINAYNRKNVSGYTYSTDYSSRKPQTQLPMMLSVGIKAGF